ncbi:hypothetical protein CLU79DRAFT_833263 [Phycomyces nitens]|nr:hypothetical protein CLU79DRAFT_833263 [Phycomyces nitens]
MPLPTSSRNTLITLQDAITDSPVYRANILHFDEQLDLLERWLETLSKHMKLYCDRLNKFNLETNLVCKKAIPVGIDDTLIDCNFTGAVIKSFSDALQTSLAFKTKLVSDLEDNFIQPLQQFVKTHLKEFKDFRRQHEKSLERYEAQLAKYTAQSKTKEASAVREEAFRLHEARKSYIRMSGQHVLRILHFRSILEHCLVEHFSAATLAHLSDLDGGTRVWQKLDSSLASWKQWLIDDKETCDFQLYALQTTRKGLENEYIQKVQPPRDLDRYVPSAVTTTRHSIDFSAPTEHGQTSYKWGYLFVRGSRSSWTRRWYFLYDGYFGSCHVSPSIKLKGAITMSERVSVLLCDIKPLGDVDRRFCFEVMCAQQPSFVLQAESEEEMRSWIAAFERSKRLMLQNEHAPEIVPETTTTQMDSTSPAIVMLSTTADVDKSTLANATSLTPLLVWEAAKSQMASNTAGSLSVPTSPTAPTHSQSLLMSSEPPQDSQVGSSWGIPWALVPSMFQSTDENGPDHIPAPGSAAPSTLADIDGHQVVWPNQNDDFGSLKVDILGYSIDMEAKNKELRRLFGGVATHEVVVYAFTGLLKKKPAPISEESVNTKELESPPSPSPIEPLEQEFNAHLTDSVKKPNSDFGFAYTGRAFITQETFWFYSCVLMTCVNTVAVRLKDILAIRLVRDPSLVNVGTSSHIAIAIDLAQSTSSLDNQGPLIITGLLDDIEVISERLRFAVDNAKSRDPLPLQSLYDILQHLSAATSKKKKTDQVTTIKVEPVKSASSPDFSTTLPVPDIIQPEPSTSPQPTKAEKKKRAHRKSTAADKKPLFPAKTGALATAMMAATVAGGNGFFDVNRVARIEEAQKQVKQKPVLNLDSTVDHASTDDLHPNTENGEKVQDDVDALPAHIKAPSGPCSCECTDHLEKMEKEIELPISAKRLYELMFSEEQTGPASNNSVWERKTIQSNSKDYRISSWESVDGQQQRVLKYVMPVSNPMVKVKEAEVVENQVILKKEDYIRYVVQISTKTAQLPYADVFVPSMRYCITWVSPTESKLVFHIGVKFVKSSMMKSIISKAALKGMAESVAMFAPILEDEAEKIAQESSKSSGLKPAGSLKRKARVASMRKKPEAAPEAPKEGLDKWMALAQDVAGTVMDVVTEIPFYVGVSIAGVVTIWILWIMLRAGSPSKSTLDLSQCSSMSNNRSVTSRAVYLRDLEDGLLKSKLQPAYLQSESFRTFLSTKTAPGREATPHEWSRERHHQFAVELLFSRERIAMLRHDTLVIFQLLNEVDAQLLENEYMNWLMDTRSKCSAPSGSPSSQKLLECEQIKHALKGFLE